MKLGARQLFVWSLNIQLWMKAVFHCTTRKGGVLLWDLQSEHMVIYVPAILHYIYKCILCFIYPNENNKNTASVDTIENRHSNKKKHVNIDFVYIIRYLVWVKYNRGTVILTKVFFFFHTRTSMLFCLLQERIICFNIKCDNTNI